MVVNVTTLTSATLTKLACAKCAHVTSAATYQMANKPNAVELLAAQVAQFDALYNALAMMCADEAQALASAQRERDYSALQCADDAQLALSDARENAYAQYSALLASMQQSAVSVVNTGNGAKVALRQLFDADAERWFTVDELCALTGKSRVNITTQLSDMRSAKYAGKHGVYMTISQRTNGVTRYKKA